MNEFLTEVQQTLFPRRDAKDGPLPPLLVSLTVVTGLVDAFSYLVLGHVFVANMTGNVLFLAFALAGAKGFSTTFSIIALVVFFVGSVVGGRMGSGFGQNRGRLLSTSIGLHTLFVGIAAVVALLALKSFSTNYQYATIVTLAFSMGIQNAAVRKLGVPDLTTTVLTLTITGMGADSHFAGGSGSKAGRRLISIAAMFFGALLGTLMILYASVAYPLIIAFVISIVVAAASRIASRGSPAWTSPK